MKCHNSKAESVRPHLNGPMSTTKGMVMTATTTKCPCWVGHGDCGGCGEVPFTHEYDCGWEQNPDCPEHGNTSPLERADVDDKRNATMTQQEPHLWEIVQRCYDVAADETVASATRNVYRTCANQLDDHLGGATQEGEAGHEQRPTMREVHVSQFENGCWQADLYDAEGSKGSPELSSFANAALWGIGEMAVGDSVTVHLDHALFHEADGRWVPDVQG